MSQTAQVAADLMFSSRVDAGDEQGHVGGGVAAQDTKVRAGLFAVEGLVYLDVGPVRNAAYDGRILFYHLAQAKQFSQFGGCLAVMGQEHDALRFAVQPVDRVQFVSGAKFGLGQAGQGAVVREAGALGQDSGWLVPDGIMPGLGDQLRLGRDKGQQGGVVIDLQALARFYFRGSPAQPGRRAPRS